MKKPKQTPELKKTKDEIKLSILMIQRSLNKIPENIDSESEAYMSQIIRWRIEDIERLKDEIKRYYVLKKHYNV